MWVYAVIALNLLLLNKYIVYCLLYGFKEKFKSSNKKMVSMCSLLTFPPPYKGKGLEIPKNLDLKGRNP